MSLALKKASFLLIVPHSLSHELNKRCDLASEKFSEVDPVILQGETKASFQNSALTHVQHLEHKRIFIIDIQDMMVT